MNKSSKNPPWITFLTMIAAFSLSNVIRAELLDSEFASAFPQRDYHDVEFSNDIYDEIQTINKLIDSRSHEEALDELALLEKRRLSDFEQAVVWQIMGYLRGLAGEQGQAIAYFEKSLATDALPKNAHQNVLFSLASLYAGEGEYLIATQKLHEWLYFEEEPVADAYMLMGSWFAALERHDDALPFLIRAINEAQVPVESWYALTIRIQLQEQLYAEAIPLLKTMLSNWPRNAQAWEMLTAAYMEAGNEKAALDAMMSAYNFGLIRSPQRIKTLVELNLYHGIPFAAAAILENEMFVHAIEEDEGNVHLLMNAWIQAREFDRAVAVIGKLVELSNDPSHWLSAARLEMVDGGWQAAADNAARAIDAGIDEIDEAHMLRGIALSEAGMFDEALQHFRYVAEHGNATEAQRADQWLRYTETARENQKLLAAE